MLLFRRFISVVVLVLMVGLFTHCREPGPAAPPAIPEQRVQDIPLTGPIDDPSAEVSGLAWYGDHLILLPQYPNFPETTGGGRLFTIPKADILAYLDDRSRGPLQPDTIVFVAPDLNPRVAKFEGYEAIVFDGEQAYLTIEDDPPSPDVTGSYLVAGTIAQDLSAFTVETTDLLKGKINTQSGVENMAEETLLLTGGRILTIHEANGPTVNDAPVAHVFDRQREPIRTIPFPPIPYRITDATALDSAGHFWTINYMFFRDIDLRTHQDPFFKQFGEGPTHAKTERVERLVEFQLTRDSIALTGAAPIQLALLPNASRNWEGIVRLDDRGFLLITDEHPETLLAFVPKP